MINIGLAGCGYWGPNLLRNFSICPNCKVKAVADIDDKNLKYVTDKYPKIITTNSYKELLKSGIDAVVLATPARTHFSLAKEALLRNKHVLVEKPLAMSVKEGKALINLADKRGLCLMAGHTFEYNAAVRELKKQLDSGAAGKPYYFYSQRLNFGIVREDINALWNLAPHDISILIYLIGKMPLNVSCKGYAFIQEKIEDVVFMSLTFPDNIAAHIQVSWLDPNKVRRLTVVGSEKMIVYDDVADSKIQIFDKGIKRRNIKDSLGAYDDFGKYQLIKHAGDVIFPQINFAEPLKEECQEFVDSIFEKRKPLTDGENGLRVVKVLEAAQKSIEKNGKSVSIPGTRT
ncbi:MAG: Gfo/Idh/MocA family oxidoreductase [Candidatus Omnitrophica bacterium]|nr:Gfo/Idh/MocA family oxidoreductase [Candidatus Omnitrophota bacterium]